jgi:hypothetical protein
VSPWWIHFEQNLDHSGAAGSSRVDGNLQLLEREDVGDHPLQWDARREDLDRPRERVHRVPIESIDAVARRAEDVELFEPDRCQVDLSACRGANEKDSSTLGGHPRGQAERVATTNRVDDGCDLDPLSPTERRMLLDLLGRLVARNAGEG